MSLDMNVPNAQCDFDISVTCFASEKHIIFTSTTLKRKDLLNRQLTKMSKQVTSPREQSDLSPAPGRVPADSC